jgi:DNA/RNA-binding protein KIN17
MMKLFAENAEHYISAHSNEFHTEFLALLQRKKANRADANQLYQEHILDPEHMHLNATRWTTLSDYVMWLGKEGHARVEEGENGFLVSYIDRSSVVEKQEQQKKRAAIERSEEERERLEIQKQVDRAQQQLKESVL